MFLIHSFLVAKHEYCLYSSFLVATFLGFLVPFPICCSILRKVQIYSPPWRKNKLDLVKEENILYFSLFDHCFGPQRACPFPTLWAAVPGSEASCRVGRGGLVCEQSVAPICFCLSFFPVPGLRDSVKRYTWLERRYCLGPSMIPNPLFPSWLVMLQTHLGGGGAGGLQTPTITMLLLLF